MSFNTLNPWAILVAALSAFAIGGLGYVPFLFSDRVEVAPTVLPPILPRRGRASSCWSFSSVW